MAEQFSEKKQLVLGYGPYKAEPGFLNKLIRFDTTMIAVHYFSMALMRMPYMGVGRNMAYTKSVFNSVNGFKSHYSVASGDDDLFVQEAAKKKNYAIQLEPDSYMYSDAKTTWETFVIQKSRHYSTSPHYKVFKKLLLGIYPLTSLLLLLSFVILGGLVEDITLRHVRLRDYDGTVHFIPNSLITTVSNMSRGFAQAVVDLRVAYREDLDEVFALIRETGERLRADATIGPRILDPLELAGVERLEDSAVIVRCRFKVAPLAQWEVRREFLRRLKAVFDERGIEVPFPRVTYQSAPERRPATAGQGTP